MALMVAQVHRQLAEIVHMNTTKEGFLVLGKPELKWVMQLLRVNYALVYQHDSLKELSLVAYEMGDAEWLHSLCAEIEKLETEVIKL
ncbi:hypothetical protein SAMN04487970_10064 [Paenibacillus tianmuensis]|uniref:Uncharacterized protein n=1 Tax=Paenibacillus tianmuensis TaxID=624147 RepID=A0A1G4Q8W0_9BACL|nr:hypothetical protein [Paenibacillus tianmuensis]SCW41043.1 hypothetical protein SAMN04487970_10064 [Paenibacillus tianmuensis]